MSFRRFHGFPMSTSVFIVPHVLAGATVVRWVKFEGQIIHPRDIFVTLEMDKVAINLRATTHAPSVILRCYPKPGDALLANQHLMLVAKR